MGNNKPDISMMRSAPADLDLNPAELRSALKKAKKEEKELAARTPMDLVFGSNPITPAESRTHSVANSARPSRFVRELQTPVSQSVQSSLSGSVLNSKAPLVRKGTDTRVSFHNQRKADARG